MRRMRLGAPSIAAGFLNPRGGVALPACCVADVGGMDRPTCHTQPTGTRHADHRFKDPGFFIRR